MTEDLYNKIWAYVVRHKEQHAGSDNPAVTILDALFADEVIQKPDSTAEIREIYDCIDSALKFGEKIIGGS